MWCKAHSVDIVGAAEQFFRRSLQDLQSGPETVIWTGGGRVGGDRGRAKVRRSLKRPTCWHGKPLLLRWMMKWCRITDVHHRKPRVTTQVALKTAALRGRMEDLYSVVWDTNQVQQQQNTLSLKFRCVCRKMLSKLDKAPRVFTILQLLTCGSSSRLGVSWDDARVPEAAEIQPVPVVVVLTKRGGQSCENTWLYGETREEMPALVSPPPSAPRGPWRHRRWCVVSARTVQGWGPWARMGRRHRWCWGQTHADHVWWLCLICYGDLRRERGCV